MLSRLTRRGCLTGSTGIVISLLAACKRGKLADNRLKPPQLALEFIGLSQATAFFPLELTCDGANQSPALRWSEPPASTQSWLLLLESAGQPPKIHWLIYDLPAQLRQLPAALPNQPFLSQGGLQAKNDFGQYGYRGPCADDAVSDAVSAYVFRLYALSSLLDLPPGVSLTELRAAFQPLILATASLTLRYAAPDDASSLPVLPP